MLKEVLDTSSIATPESEVYRFGNGGLLTSTERVTVPVVLADHPLLLSALWTACGKPCEGLVWTSKVAKTWNGRSQPLEDSVAGHYCVTLSPERYAGLLKLESSPDPPTSRLRPRPTSLAPKSSRSRLASTLEICLSLSAATTFVDSSGLIAIPQQMCLILTNALCSKLPVIQVGRIL